MAVATRENVAELYVAFFGRAPDSTGLDYWVNGSGLDLEGISESFFDQPETQERYPIEFSNEDFVAQIYLNLFNREPDQTGLDYWVAELNLYDQSGGTAGIPRDQMILAVVNGAQGDDAVILENKTNAGLYFADAGLEYVDFYLQDISADPQSAEILKDRVDMLVSMGAPELVLQLDEAITSDDMIDRDEAGSDIPISGYVYSEVEGDKKITLTVNGKAFFTTIEGNDFSVDVPGIDLAVDPDHTIDAVFMVTDKEENRYTVEDTESYEVVDGDIIPPDAPVIETPITGDDMLNADEAIHFSIGGTAESLSTIDFTVTDSNGGEVTAQTITYTGGQWGISGLDLSTLENGILRIDATATDIVGNRSEAWSTAILLDTVSPGNPVVELLHDSGSSATDRITNDPTLLVTPYDPIDRIEYSIDGVDWSMDIPTYENDGQYKVYVREVDPVGNISLEKTISFTLDQTIPDAPEIKYITEDSGILADDAITSDPTLFFSGSSEADTVVELWLDSEELGSIDASSSGNWSKNYTQVRLEDGNYVLSGRATDVAGNVSGMSLAFPVTVDTHIGLGAFDLEEADDTGFFSDDNHTNISAPSFLVELNEYSGVGDRVELLLDDSSLLHPIIHMLTQEDLENGRISLQVADGDLGADGEKVFSVISTDLAGNSLTTSELNLFLDRSTPSGPSIELVEDTGVSDRDHITRNGAFTVQLSEVNSVAEYSFDGIVWQSEAPQFTTDGAYLFYTREVDLAGNISSVESMSLTLDVTSPVIPSIDMPIAEDSTINAQEAKSLRLSGNAEADSLIYLIMKDTLGEELNIETLTNALGEWEVSVIDISALQDGEMEIGITAVDRAGNSSPEQWSQVLLDTTVPPVPQVALARDTGLSDSDYVTLDGALQVTLGDASDSVEYSLNGGAWSSEVPQYDGDGHYTVRVRELNSVGSFSEAVELSFVLDTTAPPAPIVIHENDTGVPGDLYTNDPSLLVIPSETDGAIEYYWDGVTWSTEAPSADSGDGSYTIWVRERDLAGNASEITEVAFVLDTTVEAPQIVLVNDSGTSGDLITNDGRVSVTPNEAESDLEYSLDGESWSSDVPEYGEDGDYTVYAREIDKAGNVSDPAALTLTLDTKAPSLLDGPKIAATPAIALLIDEAGEAGLYSDPDDAGTLIGGKLIMDMTDGEGHYGGELLVAAQAENPLSATLAVKDVADNLAEPFVENVLLGTDLSDLMGESQTVQNQIFFGFLGDDQMVSGNGADQFLGGEGSDQFVFDADSGNSTDTIDLIMDFTTGIDVIKTGYAYSDDPRNYTEMTGSSFTELSTMIQDAELSYLGHGERYVFYYGADLDSNSTDEVSGYLLIDWEETPDGQVDQVIELAGIATASDFAAEDIIA